MSRIRTPEQEAKIAKAQADFEAVKSFIVLFREALLDPSKEAAANTMLSSFTDAQRDLAKNIIFRLTISGKLHGAGKYGVNFLHMEDEDAIS